MLLYSSIFVVLLALVHTNALDEPTVKLTLGDLRGHHKQSHNGRTFSAFEGIPFAKPPLGELRFAEPQPAEPWKGEWSANTVHTCIQFAFMVNAALGQEDCLYVNVYVPRDKPVANENLDVVVHIHGGAFMIGSPELAGPDYLMDRDIVYVNFNYRLGVLGFLSTEDSVVPGNNGLKDQVLALKWVQEHISEFGGNPNSVTVIGLSAGGMSTHLHYFSQLSRGLFHRGFSQSGVATAPIIQKATLRRTKKLASTVGCDQTSTKDLVKCLRQRSAYQLVSNVEKLYILPGFPLVTFGPVIEDSSSTAFLTDYPENLLAKGDVYDVPWISTIVSEEGILALMIIGKILDHVNENWNQLVPSLLEYDQGTTEAERDSISRKIKEFYFENKTLSPELFPQLIKLFGHRFFDLHLEKSTRLQSKVNKSPVYSYIYSYKASGTLEVQKNMLGVEEDVGVAHGADGFLMYDVKLVGMPLSTEKITEEDEAIKEVLIDTVASFAKKGYPELKGVSWKPVSNIGDFGYLSIESPESVKMVYEKEIAPTQFWESLPIKDNHLVKSVRDEL